MPAMTGTFELILSENFETYLLVIGVNESQFFAQLSPTIQITKEGDEWNITSSTSYKTTEIKFKLGQEFSGITEYDRFCKSVITQEGEDKLVEVQNYEIEGLTSTIIREFTDTDMRMPFKDSENEMAYRVFQRK